MRKVAFQVTIMEIAERKASERLHFKELGDFYMLPDR